MNLSQTSILIPQGGLQTLGIQKEVQRIHGAVHVDIRRGDGVHGAALPFAHRDADSGGAEHPPVIVPIAQGHDVFRTQIIHIGLFLDVVGIPGEDLDGAVHILQGFPGHTEGIGRENLNF